MNRIVIAGISVLALGLFAFALASIAQANEATVQITEVINNTSGNVEVHAEARSTDGQPSRAEVRVENRGDGSPIRVFKSVEGDGEVRIELPKDRAFISVGPTSAEGEWKTHWPFAGEHPALKRLDLLLASTTPTQAHAVLEARIEALQEKFATRTEAWFESEGRFGFLKWFARLFSAAN